ncbi:MAG: hypothetical protein B0D92_06445 [Spirochaeta sp. LUC14_002_19_P3]|nr:MAG: hypothetical protein B0D92_06445 [Spirochaeta sp. LUC14_002_19_P3]
MDLQFRLNWPLPCLILLGIFVSCLDVKAELSIKRNGRVDIALEYLLTKEFAEFGRGFGADDPWPLPITEKDFILQTIRHEGVKLKRYRLRQSADGEERVLVQLEAESVEAMRDFLGWDIVTEGDSKSGLLRIILPPVRSEAAELLNLLPELKQSEFELRVKLSGMKTVTGGEMEGSAAVFRTSPGELLTLNQSPYWEVSW